MSTFPDVYDTVYAEGGLPFVKANTLNATQAEAIRTWKALRGGDFLVKDDFLGSAINTGLWTKAGNVAPSGPTTGDFGCAYFGTTGTGTNQLTSPLTDAFGSNPIRFGARVKKVVGAGTWSTYWGINSTTAADKLAFIADNTGAAWLAQVGAVSHILAVNVSTTYQDLRIVRADGYVTFYIDGVVVYGPVAHTTSLSANAYVNGTLINSTSAGDYWLADYVYAWCERLPISATAAGAALGQHCESQNINFAGAGAVVMTFNTAFPDTNYFVSEGGASAASPPTFRCVKSVGSMSITPTSAWTGLKTFTVYE